MKKLLFILFLIFTINIYSNNIEVVVNTPGTLSQVLGDEDRIIQINSIKIIGEINNQDIKLFRGSYRESNVYYCGLIKCTKFDLSEAIVPNNTLDNAFNGREDICEVILPKNLKSIGFECFKRCHNITNIMIPESVTSIEGNAFWDCTNIVTLNIPKNVVFVGINAFYNMCGLKEINCWSTYPPITDDLGIYTGGYITLHVLQGSKAFYRNNVRWGMFNIVQDLSVITSNNNAITNSYKIINNEIISNDLNLSVYSIDGTRINWRCQKLNGLYVIKSHNYSEKILIW